MKQTKLPSEHIDVKDLKWNVYYQGNIVNKCYQAMINYEVEIDD